MILMLTIYQLNPTVQQCQSTNVCDAYMQIKYYNA